MNLMLNTYCNFHCPYCFAQSEMKNNKIQNISKENFKKFLDFCKNSDEKDVRIIGGEPTLHPNFFDFIDMVVNYNYFDRIVVFSNFSFSLEFAEKIIEYNKKIPINFLPNINNNPKYIQIVERNLDLLTMAIPESVYRISINIFDPNQDMSFWENIIAKYNIKEIRWSITVPNTSLNKDFNFKQYFHNFQDILKEMLSWTTKYNINLSCDCNNPPICAYDDDFIVYAMKVDPCFFGELHCTGAAMDVTPNLDVIGCFGCNGYKERLENFNTISEIYDDLQEKEKWLRQTPPQEECLKCPRHARTGNFCGCLGYRKENIND